MAKSGTTVDTRTILVILKGGKRRQVSNIPANAKITYGPVSPGGNWNGNQQNALRIYTSQQNQLAVFVGVEEFRDLSLTIQEQKVSTPRARTRTADLFAA
ncbi:hypothetical protein [Mycobacteroides franklinii]|uniref:Uncharacterized protein n=1 Tax=Mycobacteroides franklinii TaxID=948102 RepID=A0A4R8RBQ4_9MYCO|nr:hypothetical protein [Mycobacteroides franklinii]TDZ42200.1 hypothetical protein CCUG64054_02241 [Mycobacteroides franklinii]TDZ52348.1 hypothetical protein CCUG63697_00826 [Mycobacteroides franklinii]TDZ55755.1 hypothetical protein CCUG63696_02243 [Mycobacteroides franklinii]TDZ62696.1 hypothetical protein CCUG63695_02168 [Mycobacteroides franklinii]TDZ69093.1 hypothetical protein CCUG64056_02241 [Mycobacteroides franklinii]